MLTNRSGFTMVEVVVALTILSVAVLGIAGSTSKLAMSAAGAERRAQAVYAAQDRIGRIEMDGRYAALDSLYAGVEADVPIQGLSRTTSVTHVSVTDPQVLEYKLIYVAVSGIGLTTPIERTLVMAAP